MTGSRVVPAWHEIGSVFAHLRLPVQLTLAPLYLWGVFGAGGGWSATTVGAFIVIHLFLYGGATVFNSYYDRDDGPIMGLARPPTLPPWTLPAALGWLAIGVVPAALLGVPLLALYLAYGAAGVLYSHPRWRLKGRPYISCALIFVFQGLGGFSAGWLAGGGTLSPHGGARFALMGLVAACTTLGLYPLSQVYQVAEDAARGDRTLAMVLGPTRTFALAISLFLLAGAAGTWAMIALGRPADALLLLVGYAGLVGVTLAIGMQIALRPVLATYHRLAAVQFGAATFFALFVLLQFVHLF